MIKEELGLGLIMVGVDLVLIKVGVWFGVDKDWCWG